MYRYEIGIYAFEIQTDKENSFILLVIVVWLTLQFRVNEYDA